MRAGRLWLALLMLAGPAAADIPPGLDPGAPEEAELTARLDAALDSYDLPVGPFTREERRVRPLEGRVIRSAWRLAHTPRTPGEVVAGYRERLAAIGFEPAFLCHDRACGGFDFRFGIELLPAPEMLVDTADFSQLSMAAPDGRFASVLASRVLGDVYVHTVMVEGEVREPPAPAPALPNEAAPEAPSPPADAPSPEPSLLDRLRADGHADVAGVAFDPGAATLSAASGPALDRIAAMLARAPDLSVAVVGHSDNIGGLKPNLELSRRRAEAVREALIARGVAPERLEAHGVAWLAPAASNAAEEGRRRNRRVELVLN